MTADKIKMSQSPDMGLEPMTLRLKVWCSTDWANRAAHTRVLFIDQVKLASSLLCVSQLAYKFNFVFVIFQVFDGNTDRHSIVYHQFLRPFTAINVRFYPKSWYSWISMRAEVYGCSGIVELNQNIEMMVSLEKARNRVIEVLHGGHVACQEQYNIIPMGQNVHSNAIHFYCSCHATWPPCKTSIDKCVPVWIRT